MAGSSLIRTLYRSSKTVRAVVKDAGRARSIVTIFTKYGFLALLDTGRRDKTQKLIGSGEERLDLATRAVSMLEELGPTFVKFGQIFSTRPDLIPPRLAQRLQSLQDHVSEVPYEEVIKVVEAGLGDTVDSLFAEFDEEPIASASIAQVYGAKTHAGESVVVKVQRPRLRPTIEADLSLLRFFIGRVLEVFPESEMFDLPGMADEFERSLMRELDFDVERSSLKRFDENFKDNERIHIPKVYDDLSARTVLTMERLEGKKLTEIDDEDLRQDVAHVYLDAAYQMLFKDGFFHGDLHPGNVMLEDDGRLGLIDFGMVGRLSQPMRQKLVDVLFSVLREDLESVARIWFAIGKPSGRVDYAAFEANIIEVLEKHAVGRSMEQIDVGGFFRALASVAVVHRIRLPSDFTMMFKAMITTEGLAKQLAQNINPIEAARPYIETLIKERYSLERLKTTAASEVIYLADLAKDLPGRVERLMIQAEAGDIVVRNSHENLEGVVHNVVRGINRLAVALVTASAALTGALTIDKGSAVIFGMPMITLVSFGFALGGTIWLGAGVLRGK